jgi:glucose/arabinose dehydrogenase
VHVLKGTSALQLAVAVCFAALVGTAAAPATARAVTLPAGFGEEVAFSGLTHPMAVEFAPDGRVFVAEKSGLIKVFSGPEDDTPGVVADLRTNVHNFWDRGLLDIALDPEFASDPYVYALYTHDAEIGGTAPRWGAPGATSDGCPNPPGATTDGCVVSGRLSRFPVNGDSAGPEQVLIEDWCQQYPSHSVGSIAFDESGALYLSAGDGASFTFVDYGQKGNPLNPCGDPPAGVGGTQSPPGAEGGALRSQDFRTPGSDPTGLDGTVIRVDPSDGSALGNNPHAGNADPNARRLIAQGLRNPFRFAIRPGTSELWIGEVGSETWEEINRLNFTSPRNFGWPCREGFGSQPGYDAADLTICEDLYANPGATAAPFYAYRHDGKPVPGESCPKGSSSIAGLAFYGDGPFPASYDGALFFADYSRDCIWAMRADAQGIPNPKAVETFAAGASNPVNLEVGEGGALYYPDFDGGAIRAIRFLGANQPPTAVATADPTSGTAPLTVQLDGTGSSDPNPGDTLTYEWDLDGDGQLDDSTSATPRHTYQSGGSYVVKLRVTDEDGASDTASLTINVDNSPPVPEITSPGGGYEWAVGDEVEFAGEASDAEDGALPPSALDWDVTLHHCPSNCHPHHLQSFEGTDADSFPAPDHEYPSHLELTLTATDSEGLEATRSVLLYPSTVNVTLQSDPAEISLTLNGATAPAPFTTELIVGSTNTISAPASVDLDGEPWDWEGWDHGGARTQTVTPDADVTYTARYGMRDRTAPDTLIDSGPTDGSRINDPTPEFRFSSTEAGSSFECRLDSGRPADFEPCSSPVAIGPLADGPHTFQVRATDPAGNRDQSPDGRTFVVDTSLPPDPNPPPDETLPVPDLVPDGHLSGRKRQEAGKPIEVDVSCDQDCTAAAKGRVVIRGGAKEPARVRAAGGRKARLKLKEATEDLAAGETVTLRLKPKGGDGKRKLRRLLRRGKKAKAEIEVNFSYRAGSSTTESLTIRLIRKP